MKVAIPRFGEAVAPCFEYSATISVFTIQNKRLLGHADFTLQSRDVLDRVRLLKDQNVDVLICGGLQTFFEDLVSASGIRCISWVSGNVDELLDLFIKGQLISGSGGSCRIESPASGPPGRTDKEDEHS